MRTGEGAAGDGDDDGLVGTAAFHRLDELAGDVRRPQHAPPHQHALLPFHQHDTDNKKRGKIKEIRGIVV